MYFDRPETHVVLQDPANALAAAAHSNPYPFYRSLRLERPFCRDEDLGMWVVSDHAGVQAALGNASLRVRPPGETVPAALQGSVAGEVFDRLVRMNDGLFHAAHKPEVEAATRQIKLEKVGHASRLALAELLPRRDANALLTALPIRVMARLLQVAEARLDEVTAHVLAFVGGITGGASAGDIQQASGAATALQGLWGPGIDPITVANRIGFMQQSVDATAGLLGNTAHLLMQSPDWQKTLAASPDAARELVAEVVRWDAPVQNTRRWAAQDAVINGHQVAAGECLLLLLASANRDEAFNASPDEFLPDRQNRRSMTFGSAAHACPGDQIAIEIVAACTRQLCAAGPLHGFFGPLTGYLPLPNARIPVFSAPFTPHAKP